MNKNLLMLAALALVAVGCKKDKDEEPTPTPAPTTGVFKISLGFHWGEPDFNLDDTYTDGAGHTIKFSAVKFYLSETHVENAGSIVGDFHNSFILADASNEQVYTVGNLTAGSFDNLAITVGLDSEVNHADPTLAAAPLNDPSMHWSWNPAAGYKFLVLEGRVDGNGDNVIDDTDPAFEYHCATDACMRTASIPMPGSIAAGGSYIQHIHVRVNQLVTGVDMLTTPMGHGNEAVNAQLMDNLAGALEIE